MAAHPDVAFVGGADASLDINTQRPLGLLRRDWTHQGGVIFTAHMTDKGAHCEGKRGGGGGGEGGKMEKRGRE